MSQPISSFSTVDGVLVDSEVLRAAAAFSKILAGYGIVLGLVRPLRSVPDEIVSGGRRALPGLGPSFWSNSQLS